MEKFWRTMTHTNLVLGTETLPRKRDITEKELNFKARCSTYLTMTVDTLFVLRMFWNKKGSLAKDFSKIFSSCGRSNCEVSCL